MKHYLSFSCTAQGYNHIKANKECQDSSGDYSDELMSIIVVADGHGSDNYPRTGKGALFAVNAALNAIKEFVIAASEDGVDVYADQKVRFHDLIFNILNRWHEYVVQDVNEYPFDVRDLEKVSEKYRVQYLSGKRCEKAYGTTLIAVCVTEEYWFGLHIGDGKCVVIDSEGNPIEPIPWDENCQANITTSICDSDAGKEFRYFCDRKLPLGIFIGSDGIDDSYAGLDELYSLYRTILCLFAEDGIETGTDEVCKFLPQISLKGSGDDVSLAGLISSKISIQTLNFIKAKEEYDKAQREVKQLANECLAAQNKMEYIAEALQKATQNLVDIKKRHLKATEEFEQITAKKMVAEKNLQMIEAQFKETQDIGS